MRDLIQEVISVEELFTGAWVKVSERGSEPEIKIPSHCGLNELLWGLHRQELFVLAARTSHCKTSLALQLTWDVASQGFPAYFFSLEMTKEALIERLFCQQMHINNLSLQRGEITQEVAHKAAVFEGKIREMPFLIVDSIGRTIEELYTFIETLEPKPAVVVIDYVQAIRGLKGETYDIINEYIRQFRELAVRYNFCGVLLSQINRTGMNVENKEPHLWQIKSTGVLEEHADAVLLLHWNYLYSGARDDFNLIEIIIAKQKNGRTGKIISAFEPSTYRFSDIEEPPFAKEIRQTFEGKNA